MQTMPWIERRFAFDTPASLFPPLLERLRGAPARVEDRLRTLTPEVLRRRDGSRWSIQENAGHLLDVERLWRGRLEDFESGLEVLRPADMENRRTGAADHNSRELTEILGDFRESRAALVAKLEAMEAAAIERVAHHPRLNRPMRVIDMVFFAAEHDDHHLARMTELIRAFSKQ